MQFSGTVSFQQAKKLAVDYIIKSDDAKTIWELAKKQFDITMGFAETFNDLPEKLEDVCEVVDVSSKDKRMFWTPDKDTILLSKYIRGRKGFTHIELNKNKNELCEELKCTRIALCIRHHILTKKK